MKRLAYMAHPVAGDIPGNLARAEKWLAWIYAEHRELIVVCPWLHDVLALPLRDEVPVEREEGMQRMIFILGRCDVLVLCGGRLSAGMARELGAAQLAGLEVINMLGLGPEPPSVEARAAAAKEEP